MKNKFLIGFAVVAALIFSGMLGKGDLLGVKTVFGYTYRHATSGGGGVVTTPSVTVQTPVSGGSYTHGAVLSIAWSSADGAFVKYRVSYSSDNGTTWTSVTDNATGMAYSWTVPTQSTTQGIIKVEGIDYNGTVLATGTSGTFTVLGTTVAPPPVAPPTVVPVVDPTVHGSYTAAEARANNPTIADDKALTPVTNAFCTAGSLIKSASLPAVYYCGVDGKRYVFVNDKAFFSWYTDFSTVKVVSDATLASIAIGGNITYRPGTRMIKIQSDPKVYTVARGGILRWIPTEAIAISLYGAHWNQQVDDVSDSFFVNYRIGDPISQ